MSFLNEARSLTEKKIAEAQRRVDGYVPRILVREGTPLQEAQSLRSWGKTFFRIDRGKLLEDDELTSFPRLMVIGNAGSGKSYILVHGYLQSCNLFLREEQAPFPCFLDLPSQLPSSLDLEEALEQWYRGLFNRVPSEYPPGCVLFLDGLDDLLRTGRCNFIDILFFLNDHRDKLLSVILACRRAFWSRDWFQGVSPPFEVFHTDYLGFEDYAAILPDLSQRQDFFDCATSLGIADLLQTPFVGFDLARSYQRGESLPSNRQDWFQQQLEKLLKGTEADRQKRGYPSPSLSRLCFLAKQLACLTAFGHAPSWTPQDATDFLGESQVLSDQQPVNCEEMQVLFQRPLFIKIGERFSFFHQLFQEYLASEALESLPLRKQRQLLESSSVAAQHRILMPHRGVAVFLAEMSPAFRDHLIEHDPLVAFLAELPSLPPEDDERLTRAVLDGAIASHRAPWWEIPPRGERPVEKLSKHRPQNVACFLRPYLENPNEVARLWGTACADAWGGATGLNELLLELAHDETQNDEIRTSAISAITATESKEDIQRLYELLDSRSDRVRGYALRAYRVTESPSPREFINKLRGGSCDRELTCLLQFEASGFGASLEPTQLEEAFQEADRLSDELGDLWFDLLRGLFPRAVEMNFSDISPSLVVKIWQSHDIESRYCEEELKTLVASDPNLFARLWEYVVMDVLGRGEDTIHSFDFDIERHMPELCTDQIFDLLPVDASSLNRGQQWFISDVLAKHFYKEPTAERLEQFQCRSPFFAAGLRLPKPPEEPPPRDLLDDVKKIVEALQADELPAWARTCQILSVMAEVFHATRNPAAVTPQEVIQFLTALAPELTERILDVFRTCVLKIEYSRSPGEKPNEWKMTPPEYIVPFWVLRDLGEAFPPEKLAEIIRCYAFMPRSFHNTSERDSALLDELRELDEGLWSECLSSLAESPHISPYDFFEYLITRKVDLYEYSCRERLSGCQFNQVDFGSLLDYWVVLRPPDFAEVLRDCYTCLGASLRQREVGTSSPSASGNGEGLRGLKGFPYWRQFEPLYVLLAEDDGWAWKELHGRVKAEDAPLSVDPGSRYRPLKFPQNPSRLPVLADWYALIRRKVERQPWPDDLARVIRESIVRIGGEEAIHELQRLQREQAFPDAEWLSHTIIRIEDQMLGMPETVMPPGQLLDFVNRESMGAVLTERDLFEWVCQAIEDVKEGIEKRGEQVKGYWNISNGSSQPKEEPDCQNVLWPAIRTRLSNLGIVDIEEKWIGASRVDLWVEKPVPDGKSLRVAVELKTARKRYGRKKLIEPIETQLWQKYLQRAGCRYGIYIVLWFKDDERYSYPSTWKTKGAFEEELNDRREEIAKDNRLSLNAYVIDMTTLPRAH